MSEDLKMHELKQSGQGWVLGVVVACICLYGVGAAGVAEAIEFQAGAGLKGGGGTLSFGNGAGIQSPPMGWGMGANIFGGIKPVPVFSIGANFDYVHYWHEDTTTNTQTNGSLPSVGIYVRGGGVNTATPQTTGVGFGGWANYVFGSIQTQIPGTTDGFVQTRGFDIGGWQFGGMAFYQIRMHPYKTFVELGAYVSYNTLTNEVEAESTNAQGQTVRTITETDSSYFTFGVLLQGNFEFGKPGFR